MQKRGATQVSPGRGEAQDGARIKGLRKAPGRL
jgi:hypothetical protein